MISFNGSNYLHPQTYPGRHETGRVLRMSENSRTAGSMPVWSAEKTAIEEIASRLETASRTGGSGNAGFDRALAYKSREVSEDQRNEFTFGDIVDMVNPLHHVPVVGNIYRKVTGDEIKSISRIVGGALFGGAAGAAGGLVNVIAEEETGMDIAGNVMSMAFNGNAPGREINSLPGTTVAFADLRSRGSAR